MPTLAEAVKPYKRTGRERAIRFRHRYPARIEKIYALAMKDMIDKLNAEMRGSIAESIKIDLRANQDGFRRDALADILRAIRDAAANVLSPINIVRNIADAIFGANERNLGQAIERAIGVNVALPSSDINNALDAWVVENVSYITKLQDDYLTSIQGVVSKGFQSGLSYSEIAKGIAERTGIIKRRANLIARDQVGSLNSQVTQQRNEELGIDEYVWRTVGDERVRGNPSGRYPKANPSHYDRDGKTYSWKDGAGAKDKHPGVGIQCRCYAESIVKF